MPESLEEKFVKKISKIMDSYADDRITEGTAWFRTIQAYNEYKQDCRDYMKSVRTMLNLTKE